MSSILSQEQVHYLNLSYGPIGRVVTFSRGNPAPGQATLLENSQGASLDIGHFLAIPTPDGQVSFAVTVAPDIRSDLDLNEIVFEAEGESVDDQAMTERPTARLWTLSIVCNTAGTARPPAESAVYFASREGIEYALGSNRIPENQRLPIGAIVNGDGQAHPIYVHAEYVLGPQGVHMTWSGLSGLSGKTMKKSLTELAIMTSRERLGLRCALVVFATKGTDDLFRDIPSDPQSPFWLNNMALKQRVNPGSFLTREDNHHLSDAALYEIMGLPTQSFESLRLYVPQGDAQWWGYRTPETNQRLGTAEIIGFKWALPQVAAYMSLFAQTDADDKLQAMEAETLRALREGYWIDEEQGKQKLSIRTLADLEAFFHYAQEHADGHRRWHGHHVETIARARARYLSIFQRAGQVVSPDLVEADQSLPLHQLRDGMVWVIDLSRVNSEAKTLVIYKVMSELYEAMQAKHLPLDRLLLDIDELNQHAPRRQSNPTTKMITAKLQDISERARTDGIILLTAQQTLSEVDERVEANIATRCYGMLGEQEARQSIYNFTEVERFIVGRLEPGEMLVQHPILRYRVKVRVPRASYIPGKDGQNLLRAVLPPAFVERLQTMLGGAQGRAVPSHTQLQQLVDRVLEHGGTLGDLERAAREVGQRPPFPDQRNTGRATYNLLHRILSERLNLATPEQE